MERYIAIGRRKNAVARIYLNSGNGNIIVNGQEFTQYFNGGILQTIVKQPLNKVEEDGNYDIKINVKGGGYNGQAEATRLAIARALVKVNADFKSPLKKEGYLSRDPRMVERKKPGRRKARRSFQFSKR